MSDLQRTFSKLVVASAGVNSKRFAAAVKVSEQLMEVRNKLFYSSEVLLNYIRFCFSSMLRISHREMIGQSCCRKCPM